MAHNLLHETAVRSSIASAVRSAIHAGTGANVSLRFYTQAEGTQTGSGFATINLGTAPFGAVSTYAFTYGGTATGTNTGTARTFSSFAIHDRDATKVIKGTVGNATGTFDLEITGGNAIADGEKIQLTSFTYTASV